MKTKKPDLASHNHNGIETLYISVKSCGINYLCLLIDGIPLSRFGKGKKMYLTVEQAIQWYETELKMTTRKSEVELYQNNIAALRSYLAGFAKQREG